MALFGQGKDGDDQPEEVETEVEGTEVQSEDYAVGEAGSEVSASDFNDEQEVATPQAQEEAVGLYGKFQVERVDGKDRPGGPKEGARYFVLDYVNDPVARVALRAYVTELRRQKIEPELADDLNREINSTRKL